MVIEGKMEISSDILDEIKREVRKEVISELSPSNMDIDEIIDVLKKCDRRRNVSFIKSLTDNLIGHEPDPNTTSFYLDEKKYYDQLKMINMITHF